MNDRLATALADRYRLERELGAGGMATVYLAHDIKHDRPVAIKVLKPELAAVLGAERFVQEIKTTAALQHPHILPLFDSGSADGFLFYVMPFIQGETLRNKLDRETQLGVNDAVQIAREVLDALQYAHEHGIVHRDIKPENILLHGGHAMVADFGIALAVSAAAGGRMTETGLSLGTPHYMSPEQATADKEITGRTDIYSLGSVLFEMLTGNPPHTGSSAQQIIMKIVTEEAQPVTRLRKSVPANVAAAVGKALEKLPADRFATAREFAEALANPQFTSVGAAAGGRAVQRLAVPGAMRRYLAWAVSAAAILLATVGGWLLGRRNRPVAAAVAVSASVVLPDSLQLAPQAAQPEGTTAIAISADGSRMAFVVADGPTTHLYVRSTSDFGTRRIDGTDGASAPFFSPNGDAIAFYADSALKRVSLADGRVSVLRGGVGGAWGGTWAPDGRIVFVRDFAISLLILSPQGDSVRAVRCDSACTFPVMLVDGRRVLVASGGTIYVIDLDTGTETALLRWNASDNTQTMRGMRPQLDGAGHLLYAGFDGRLFVVPFDERSARITGPAVAIASGVRVESGRGAAQFAISRNGVLAYAPGGILSRGILVRADRSGRLDTIPGPAADYRALAVSQDGGRIAATVMTPAGDAAIEIIDVLSGRVTPWVPGNGKLSTLSWTADDAHVVFARNDTTFLGDPNVSTAPKPLQINPLLSSVYPTGDSTTYFGWRGADTAVVARTGGGPPIRVVGPDNPSSAAMIENRWLVAEQETPDGSWAITAYALDGSGRRIVVAMGFGAMLSGDLGGDEVFGATDATGPAAQHTLGRRETFFSIRYDPAHADHPFVGPTPLFTATVADFPGRNYAVGMHGNRFVFKQHLPETPLREIRVISDWGARLRTESPQ